MSDDILETIAPNLESPIHDRMLALRRQFREPSFTTEHGMVIEGREKYLAHHFKPSFLNKHKQIELLLLTDVQYGHKCCRVDKLTQYRDWILEKPNRFCFFGGDMIDAWRVGSPGMGYDNWFSAESQFYQFCALMAPIKHRVLGFVGGNHERRGLAGGFDLGSLMAMALETPYSNGAQMISIFFGDHKPFRVYLWHGRGAARSAGGKVNMTRAITANDEAQVYFSGHIHEAFCTTGWHSRRDHKKNCLTSEKYYVLSASSFMDFWGSYAEVAGYTSGGLLMPLLLVQSNGKFRVEM